MTEATQTVPFEHINLNDVDPQASNPPNGIPMTFQVTEAAIKDIKTEKYEGQAIDFKFVVVNSNDYAGRTFYTRMFPDKEGGKNATARRLRILMDSTGIPQTGELGEFLSELVSQRATFNAPLTQEAGRKQEVNVWKTSPAS